MVAIAEREARIRAIMDKLIEPGPDSLQEKLDELRALAVSDLSRLRELLANPSEIHEARAFLAERVGKFTLQRVRSNGEFSFKADGKIDFFGDLHAWMVPGARIELATPAFSGRRSTTQLTPALGLNSLEAALRPVNSTAQISTNVLFHQLRLPARNSLHVDSAFTPQLMVDYSL